VKKELALKILNISNYHEKLSFLRKLSPRSRFIVLFECLSRTDETYTLASVTLSLIKKERRDIKNIIECFQEEL
jgi:hypothetical protein